MVTAARIIGAGRAGGAFARALRDAGVDVDLVGREGDVGEAADGVELVLIATPDGAIADVASSITQDATTIVAHCAGSLGLDVLEPHVRRASVHPLTALPDAAIGAERLRGAWFAVAGDPVAGEIVDLLGGRSVEVDDEHRTTYHAAACVASNHLVALLGQVERIAAGAGVPLEAYLDLVRGTVDNVAGLGAAAALTGPVARGDWDTVARHVAALDPDERLAYTALADAARKLT